MTSSNVTSSEILTKFIMIRYHWKKVDLLKGQQKRRKRKKRKKRKRKKHKEERTEEKRDLKQRQRKLRRTRRKQTKLRVRSSKLISRPSRNGWTKKQRKQWKRSLMQ